MTPSPLYSVLPLDARGRVLDADWSDHVRKTSAVLRARAIARVFDAVVVLRVVRPPSGVARRVVYRSGNPGVLENWARAAQVAMPSHV